jgi:PAS domain-containing protein
MHDFRLVFQETHSDSYELTKVLLAKVGFDGELKLLTSGWERMLGFAHGELTGKTLLDLMWSNPRNAAAAVAAILHGMDSGPVDLRMRCRDGTGKGLRLHRHYERHERMIYIVAEEIPENPTPAVPGLEERRAVARPD